MLAAVKGVIRGNAVIIEDDDIREYDGTEAFVDTAPFIFF